MAIEKEYVHQFWIGITAGHKASIYLESGAIDEKSFGFLTRLFELTKEIYPDVAADSDLATPTQTPLPVVDDIDLKDSGDSANNPV